MSSGLEYGKGHHLWEYWLHGEGSDWRADPHPWSALHKQLMEHAVIGGGLPVTSVDGLTTNLYVAAFHHGPNSSEIAATAHIPLGKPRMDKGNISVPDAADLDTAARKYAASQGWAMPDGSYPIRPANMHGAADLEKAIHAVGRGGGSHAAIVKFIAKRAEALGLDKLIPPSWGDPDNDNDANPRAAADNGLMFRAFSPDLEVPSTGDGRTIRGIAVPYGQVQRIDAHLTEEFCRGAFNHQMNALNRIGFYRGHSNQGGTLIGPMKAAQDDAAGLYGEWRVSATPAGDETLELVKDGALSQLSIGFRATQGGSRTVGGVVQRTKAHLFEVAIVPEGAYGDGAVITGVRSADDGTCPHCGHVEPPAETAVRSRLLAAQEILAGLRPVA